MYRTKYLPEKKCKQAIGLVMAVNTAKTLSLLAVSVID
jgi:hypothetical protein